MKIVGTIPAGTMKSAAVRFDATDVLYGRLRPYLNKVARPGFSGLGSAEFIVFPTSDLLNGSFLAYRLNAHDFVRFASHINAGDRPRVDFESIGEFEVEVPPPAEQRRIVAAIEELLSDLDAAVAALERARANLKRYRAAVLKAAVEGKLTEQWRKQQPPAEPAEKLLERILAERRRRWEEAQLAKYGAKRQTPPRNWKEKYPEPARPDTKELPELPEGWCWTSVEAVGDVLLGRQRAPQFLTGRFSRPYLRVANIKDDRIDFSDLESMDFDEVHFQKYQLQPSDILVSEGQSPELVGQSAIFQGEVDGLCFQKTLHRFRGEANRVLPEFAQLVFRAHVKSGVFRRLAPITTNIAHLTLERFCAAPFPLAPLTEQTEIVNAITAGMSRLSQAARVLQDSLIRGSRLRQSILQYAFEGKLVPQDPNDEPATILLERIRAERSVHLGKHERARRRRLSPAASAGVRD